MLIICLAFKIENSKAQFKKIDSLKAKLDTSKVKKTFKISSLKPKTMAGKRFVQSMLVPGLGQIKNKQYAYLPIIYGGAGTAAYFLQDNIRKYNYFKARRLEAYGDPTNGIASKSVKIEKFILKTGREFTYQELKPVTDGYRRNIEVTVLGLIFGWTLQAVQANVGYHLKTFDTKDDISFKIEPKIGNFGNQNGLGVSATYSFSSKSTK